MASLLGPLPHQVLLIKQLIQVLRVAARHQDLPKSLFVSRQAPRLPRLPQLSKGLLRQCGHLSLESASLMDLILQNNFRFFSHRALLFVQSHGVLGGR